ncbi:PTS fructose transporter subunit IIABC [Streptomyces qinglanensis]|uniref:PTS system, fructose-specific IIC component n=1 Tax=Streptomyces qinglanensis TaxID=943816 RepID=A0A1H9VNP8_9ACTN|nr:fructose-specific PTS transporter subunit EIIC [Streptomyces qinglanensis]SES22957.1 PTS system, fructose-specific IIC component [Streptomyces qinglanensis]
MSQLITAELVDLDLPAATKSEAARSLAERMVSLGRVTDLDGFLADVEAREAQMPTGLDGGIGIPHCRSTHVSEPTLAFGRPREPIDFGAPDGPADLVFLIAAPDGADSEHLTILSALARRLADPQFTAALRSAADPEQASALIRGDSAPDTSAAEEQPEQPSESGRAAAPSGQEPQPQQVEPQSTEPPGPDSEHPELPESSQGSATTEEGGSGAASSEPFRVVAVTSCPTGIAHTYMAAESLERAAEEDAAGTLLTVETQGSAGFQRVDPAVIAAADAVIFAHDVEVRERERFAGKPTVDVGVKAAINRPAELLREARDKAERGEQAPRPTTSAPMDAGAAQGDGFGTRLRTWLMTGVSYMVPFVAAGGLLIALSFALGGYEIAGAKSVADHFVWTEVHSWAALLNQIGGLAFGFLVPVLAGYIAYGMADRPGLVPGFVGGAVAVQIEAGFLGGLVAGLLAGALVMAVQRVGVPAVLRGIMPVVVIPLLSSALVGALMFVVVGKPIATAQQAMTDWLGGLTGTNAVLLGLLIGLMMCFDLGGPVNKVAYTFATGGIASADPGNGSLMVMAAAMAAGMVPPLGMALATTVRGSLFTRTERENGKAAWVLGASFISEGAIPFAAADPLRVIPASMAGGAVTGALSMGFGSTLRAPHGGIFVVPLIGSPLLYLVAIAAGTLVTAGATLLLKGVRKQTPEVRSSPAQDSAEPRVPAGV